MNDSADLFDWAKQTNRAKRRGPRPLGFYSALALVVKYGKLAEQNAQSRRFTGGELRRSSVSERRTQEAAPLPLFERVEPEVATRQCPRCGHQGPVDTDFGSRRLKGELRPQSWCRECRATAKRARRTLVVESEPFALTGA